MPIQFAELRVPPRDDAPGLQDEAGINAALVVRFYGSKDALFLGSGPPARSSRGARESGRQAEEAARPPPGRGRRAMLEDPRSACDTSSPGCGPPPRHQTRRSTSRRETVARDLGRLHHGRDRRPARDPRRPRRLAGGRARARAPSRREWSRFRRRYRGRRRDRAASRRSSSTTSSGRSEARRSASSAAPLEVFVEGRDERTARPQRRARTASSTSEASSRRPPEQSAAAVGPVERARAHSPSRGPRTGCAR